MNIVSTLNLWLSRLYKSAAILLVLLAVVISAFRLFLPYVHHYKVHVQDFINNKTQANITLGTLTMKWHQSGPVILIDKIDILDTENASLSIEQVELQVDFWNTLSQQTLISKDVILSGVKAQLSEELWRSNAVNDHKTLSKKQYDDTDITADIEAISQLFLNRIKHFSIRDSLITVTKESAVSSVSINHLQWLNTDERHQAQGSIVFNGVSANNVQIKVDLLGNDLSNLAGDVYLQANHIDITPWLGSVIVAKNNETAADINFSAWLSLEDSHAKQLQVNFLQSHFNWLHANKKQQLTLQSGQLLLTKDDLTQALNIFTTPLKLQFNEQPPIELTSQFTHQNNKTSLYFSTIDLALLSALSPLFIVEQSSKNKLAGLHLNGNIENLFIRQQHAKFQILGDISQLTNRYSAGIPGIENVRGKFSYVDQHLVVDFKAEQGQLDFDQLFINAFPYESISAELTANFHESDWSLKVNDLLFKSEPISVSADLGLTFPEAGETTLSLLANISDADASLVGRYLPLPLMSDNLVTYLNNAFVSGRIDDAQVLINGPMNHFPFTDGSGIFVVDAELSEAEFNFAEQWPSITDFSANLNFTNNSMLITGRKGSLTGLDVTGVKAAIDDLGDESILEVDAIINTTNTDYISALMDQSSLQSSVGSVLEELNLGGEVSGDFQLTLPLNDNGKALATGTINFSGNQAQLQTPSLDFNNIQGQLSFNNDNITTKDLSLLWQGLPLQLNLRGLKKNKFYETTIALSGVWQEKNWQSHVPNNLQAYLQGGLTWQGELSLYHHDQGGFSYQANIDSDLSATTFNLPTPYGKSVGTVKPLSIKFDGHSEQSNVHLKLADDLQFSGLLDHDNSKFTRANLMLGRGNMALPGNGFHVTTKLPTADFSVWQPLISDIIKSISLPKMAAANGAKLASTSSLFPKPERIRGSVDQLAIAGQHLHHVSFNLLDKKDWWHLEINAKETRGQVKIYPNWLAQGLDVNAEFLTLKLAKNIQNSSEPSTTSHVFDDVKKLNFSKDAINNNEIFANIPPVTFHCDACIIDNFNLGEVDASIRRVDQQTIKLEKFSANRGQSALTLSGQWQHNLDESMSSITGNIVVEDVEEELQALGYDSIIKDSGANIDIDLNWLGGFHDINIKQLNGLVSGSLDDGYLADIDDKARVFSVLSLQSLVRKLTLDFRDIFSEGMFYSRINGDYQLAKGLVTTNNTEMQGTAGDLFMKGHTDLISGNLHYDLSYKPNLTSSLPVLAWIASSANPVFFAAGVAIDQVIKSQVVSEFLFELSGTIDDPVFDEVERKSKNISIDSPNSPKAINNKKISGEKSALILKEGEVSG